MEVVNWTQPRLKTLSPLIKRLETEVGLKDSERLLVVCTSQWIRTSGGNYRWDYPTAEYMKKLFGTDPIYLIRIFVPMPGVSGVLEPLELAENITETILHELGHMYDAQRNGTEYWAKGVMRRKIAWKDRPQEKFAIAFAKEKMTVLTSDIEDLILDLAIELEEKLK